MSALILVVFLGAAVIAMPIAHALFVAAMTAAATSDKVPLDLLVHLIRKNKVDVYDIPIALITRQYLDYLNLMQELQDSFGFAYLFISHDLALVETISDRVAVMQRGRIVELGPSDDLFAAPQEEYTRRLLAAIPSPIPRSLRVAD